MMQLGDEHRGYAVECGTSLFVDGRKHHERVEALYHDLRTAVSEAVHRGEHHTEAVEQGHATTELVIGGKLHVLTGEETVVGDVVVGKHYPFRESVVPEVYCMFTTSWQLTWLLSSSRRVSSTLLPKSRISEVLYIPLCFSCPT